MNSIEPNALEPTKDELAGLSLGGRQIVGVVPDGFQALNGTFVFGLPITGFYVLVLAVVMWLIFEYAPIGRYLYATGANPKAAVLNGIPTRKFVVGAFMASGTLAALAGELLASKLRIGQASVGLECLLPALVGAFFGSTTIKPGRVNVWGTIIGVSILADRSGSSRCSTALPC